MSTARLRDRLNAGLRDLDEIDRALAATGDEALTYWRRRALRAEGSLEAVNRDKLGPEAARVVSAAVALAEARYGGDLSGKDGKPRNMGRVWREFRAAVEAYSGTPDALPVLVPE